MAPILAMPAPTPAAHPNILPDSSPSTVLLIIGPVGPCLNGRPSFGSLAAEETLLYPWDPMSLVIFLFGAFYPENTKLQRA